MKYLSLVLLGLSQAVFADGGCSSAFKSWGCFKHTLFFSTFSLPLALIFGMILLVLAGRQKKIKYFWRHFLFLAGIYYIGILLYDLFRVSLDKLLNIKSFYQYDSYYYSTEFIKNTGYWISHHASESMIFFMSILFWQLLGVGILIYLHQKKSRHQ